MPDEATIVARSNDEERAALAALHEEVGRFYVRDRRLLRAQKRFERALAAPGEIQNATAHEYVRAVARYFQGFAREAQTHLRDVERRLAHASQIQFNLTAERGVAERRVDATRGILERLQKIRQA